MATERILVTDALPYANGRLHIGHIAGVHLPGDIYVRYQRLKRNDAVHVCGADDHGVAIMLAAEKAGVSPKELIETYYPIILSSLESLGIVYDNFSQTSRPIHHDTAQAFFKRLHEKGYFEVREEDQIYCPSKDRFLPDRYVEGTCPYCSSDRARGDQCESCGSILDAAQLIDPHSEFCDGPLTVKKTKHWYFLLKRMEPQLKAWIETKSHWKDNVRNYCAGWFKEGLSDRPISRDLDWGVPIPLEHAEGKVLYVWFENVLGYVSSTREWAERIGEPERWKDYWLNPDCKLVCFLGKDNIVFHALLWPAMIMAHGDFVLPAEIPANEFLNIEGQKFSTSRNWAIWVDEYLEVFPPDPLRYYLASIAPETKDADFVWRDFQGRNNNELADIFGNFINRSLTFITRYFDGVVPEPGAFTDEDHALLESLSAATENIGACFASFQVRAALRAMIDLGNSLNKYFNDQEPWQTRKTDKTRCGTTMYICAQAVRSLAILTAPVIPFSSDRIWTMLGLEGSVHDQTWESGADRGVPAGHRIGKTEILFAKIEDEVIEAQIARLGRPATPDTKEEPAGAPTPAGTVSMDEFQRLDLRVAQIVAAEPVPKADKLLKLRIRLGEEERQIVAGIARQYPPDTLMGRQIVVVANLQATTIRGVESNGMLLAATDENGAPVLLRPDEAVQSGAKVK